jgi:hypothetical protein
MVGTRTRVRPQVYLRGPLRPKKPYRKLGDARVAVRRVPERPALARDWPCPSCGGMGKKYAPEDYDPIEGYKLATRRAPCTLCGGTGDLGKTGFKIWYSGVLDRWRWDLMEWEENLRLAKQALGKLTDEEVAALQMWHPEVLRKERR